MATIAESSLAELIADPLVELLMQSDGVDGRSIELLFETIARSRTSGGSRPWPAIARTEN